MAISQWLERRRWLPPAILTVAGAVCFASSLHGAFYCDDRTVIVYNGHLREFPWPTWLNSFRGLVNGSFALNLAAGGLDPTGFHLVNIGIHILAGCVLFGLVRRTLASPRLSDRYRAVATALATAIALVWLVHPLTTQAVTYVCQRYESAAALFYLLGMYCFRRGVDDPAGQLRWWGGVVLCFVLGLRSKETAITLPLVLACYDRAYVADSWRELPRRKSLYAVLLIVAAVLAGHEILTDMAILGKQTLSGTAPADSQQTVVVVADLTPVRYLASQPAVILHYLRLSLVPVGQCFDYGWQPVQTVGEAAGPGTVIIGLLLTTVWAMWKRPALGFLGAAFFLILAPSSSIIPIQDLAVEHRMYLPLACVVALLVVLSYEALNWCRERQGISVALQRVLPLAGPGLVVVAVLALGSETVARNRLYCSPLEFSQEGCACSPHFWRSHFQLSKAMFESGDTAGAIEELSATLELEARVADVWQTRGMVWVRAGKFDRAWQDFTQAIALDPDFGVAYFNRAMVEMDQGRYALALADCDRAIELQPTKYVRAYVARGQIYERLGNTDGARQNYDQAIVIDPACRAAIERRRQLERKHPAQK